MEIFRSSIAVFQLVLASDSKIRVLSSMRPTASPGDSGFAIKILKEHFSSVSLRNHSQV